MRSSQFIIHSLENSHNKDALKFINMIKKIINLLFTFFLIEIYVEYLKTAVPSLTNRKLIASERIVISTVLLLLIIDDL